MNKIEDIIQSVAEQTAKHTVLELRKQGMMKDDKQTPYQKTETLLYNYNSFLTAIEDKEEEINEIRVTGLKKHSNSVIPNPGSGTIVRETKTEQQKIDEKIADIRASISVTMRCIDIIDEQLEQIHNENIADTTEIMMYLTKVMRGKSSATVVVVEGNGDGYSSARTMEKEPDERERLKAAELLGKRYGMFKDTVNVEGAVPVVITDDLDEDDEPEPPDEFSG